MKALEQRRMKRKCGEARREWVRGGAGEAARVRTRKYPKVMGPRKKRQQRGGRAL